MQSCDFFYCLGIYFKLGPVTRFKYFPYIVQSSFYCVGFVIDKNRLSIFNKPTVYHSLDKSYILSAGIKFHCKRNLAVHRPDEHRV